MSIKFITNLKVWSPPDEYMETPKGQKLEQFKGWIWRCSDCLVGYVVNTVIDEDVEFICSSCKLIRMKEDIRFLLDGKTIWGETERLEDDYNDGLGE